MKTRPSNNGRQGCKRVSIAAKRGDQSVIDETPDASVLGAMFMRFVVGRSEASCDIYDSGNSGIQWKLSHDTTTERYGAGEW